MVVPKCKNVVFVCVTVGLVFLASKYRNNVFESVQQIYHGVTKKGKKRKNDKQIMDYIQKKEFKVSLDNVFLADTPEKCDYAVERIRSNLSDGVLGFDCEWVNEGPVSLLQLATQNGICALFRLNKIGVPPKLKELLTAPHLLKVGVGSFEDGKKVARDYDCKVVGTVDLRTLASRHGFSSPKSLADFCFQYLGVQMNKDREVRCGDWNAECLSDEQIVYASYDAYASVLIYYEILQRAKQKHTILETLFFQIKGLLNHKEARFRLPKGIIDARFKVHKDKNIIDYNSESSNNKSGQMIYKNNSSGYRNTVPTRNKPLYHNCYLQAPDGETLCTCDKKKAEWYVSKELGEVVSEDPFTVKLKFEPAGRTLGEGPCGKFYTLVKENQCVVCGRPDKFIKKNVVPREYRKYFPLVMKSHQSHDVLLLCPVCHEISNYHDLQLRKKLADTCDAPLSGPPTHIIPKDWRNLQSAVKVLRDGTTSIPHKRKKELEFCIMKYTGQKEVTPTLLNTLAEQISLNSPVKCNFLKEKDLQSQNKNEPHGHKVVQYFKNNGGLVMLEKLWREHFLDTMKPKFLPDLWSVSHNQERLTLRQIHNRIKPSDAKVAGIQK